MFSVKILLLVLFRIGTEEPLFFTPDLYATKVPNSNTFNGMPERIAFIKASLLRELKNYVVEDADEVDAAFIEVSSTVEVRVIFTLYSPFYVIVIIVFWCVRQICVCMILSIMGVASCGGKVLFIIVKQNLILVVYFICLFSDYIFANISANRVRLKEVFLLNFIDVTFLNRVKAVKGVGFSGGISCFKLGGIILLVLREH